MTDAHDVGQVVMLARRAAMSTSYKPALLKALARIVRREPDSTITLTSIGAEFLRMYWNQTVVFHLRQAATITKEPEVLKAIRRASSEHRTHKLDLVPDAARKRLEAELARILTLDVLRRFHASSPASMRPLYQWVPGEDFVTLTQQALHFIAASSWALEAIANLWWARYLERVNVLTPYIIEKVEREGAKRGSLLRFLRILRETDGGHCFYCERAFAPDVAITVDHVIPWSFLLADPEWDLVLACGRCNGLKSDILPVRSYITKLVAINESRTKAALPRAFASPMIGGDQIAQYYDAALTVEWPSGWQP